MHFFTRKNGIVHVRYTDGKRFHTKSMKTTVRKIARARAEKAGIEAMETIALAGALKHEVVANLLYGNINVTLNAMVDEWSMWLSTNRRAESVRVYKVFVLAWIKHCKLKDAKPMDITATHVASYINRRKGPKASSRKIALVAIQNFLQWLAIKGYRGGNPADEVRIDFSRLNHDQIEPEVRLPISDEEIQKLLAATTDRFWRFAIVVSRHTGLRLGDIAQLEWDSITPEGIVKWTGKTTTRVVVPINEAVKEALSNLDRNLDKRVFPEESSLYAFTECRVTFSKRFRRLCNKAGVFNKSFHCLRHTRATELSAIAGVPEVMKQLGHANAETSIGYIHDPALISAPEGQYDI